MNRRKLGTSRRSKGRQCMKDPETWPDVESTEDVQDEARGEEHPETHESAAEQPKVQEEVDQASERDMTTPQAAFLVSAATAESEVKTGMFFPEKHEHILESRHVNMQPFKDETKLKVMELVDENLHDRVPEVISLNAYASDQQIIRKQTEDVDLYSVADFKRSKLDDSGLFRQDGRLQGNSLVCESHISASITPKITAVDALGESIKDVAQESLLLQKEELPTSKDVTLIIPKVREHSKDVEQVAYDQNKLTQVQVEHGNNATEELLHDHKVDSCSENQESNRPTYQSSFLVKSAAVKQDILTTTEMDQTGLMEDNVKHIADTVFSEGPLSKANGNNLSVQILQLNSEVPTELQFQDSSLTTEADLSFTATRRKMGSSRKNKGRHVKKSEVLENSLGNEYLETSTVLSEIKETGQKEVSENPANVSSLSSLSHGSSICLLPQHEISSEYPEMDSQSLILKTENPQEGPDEKNPDILFEGVEKSVFQHEVDQSAPLQNDGAIDSVSENVLMQLQEVDCYPTQMQESLQIQHFSETAPCDITEHFENISGNLKDQPEISQSAGESTDCIFTKQKVHQIEENISEQLKNESYDLYDTSYLQICVMEKPKSLPSQVHEFKKGVGDDIKLNTNQTYHQEKEFFFGMDAENPVLTDTQPKEATGTVDEQSSKTFHSSSNGRKLGSSRKSRGRQDKESKEKTYDEEITDNISLRTKIRNQEDLRLDMKQDVLPVSRDGSMASILAPGHPIEIHSSNPTFYPENDPENFIPESVNIPEGQEKTETDLNLNVSYESLEKTWPQVDIPKSKSGSLPTAEVMAPYPDDMRHGQKQDTMQTRVTKPQQMDHTVDGQVGEGGVFVEDTKQSRPNSELKDNSLSTDKQTDAGLSGSKRPERQQEKESEQETFKSARHDETLEMPSRYMLKEETEDNECRFTISVSDNSLFLNPPLDQYFKEQSSVPEIDLQGLSVNSENLQESQNESKSDTRNTVDISQHAVGEFEAICSKDTRDDVADDIPKDMGRAEVHLTKMERSLQAEKLSKTSYDIEKVKTGEDDATKQENYPAATKNKDYGLYDTKTPLSSDFEKIDPSQTEVEVFKGRAKNDLQHINPFTTHQIFYGEKKEMDNYVDLFEKSGKKPLVMKYETLENKEVMVPEHSYNAVKQAKEHGNPLKDMEGSLKRKNTSQTAANPETVLGEMTDQAENLINIQSKLTVRGTEGSETKQDVLSAKDQENLCFITKGKLVSKDELLNDSNEISISSPGGVSNTLGQMDECGKFVEVGEHNPTDTKFQDSSFDTDERTEAGVGFSRNRRKLGSSRTNKGRQGVVESKPEVLENTSSDGTLQSPTMTLETMRKEKKELSEDTEHAITLSLPQDVSSVQSHIFSSEDQSSELRKYPDTDQQLLTDKIELFGDKDYNKSETGVEIIDNSMTVLQQEVDQLDTIHNKDTKDVRSDEALRKEEKVDDHQSQMQENLQTECYVGLPAGTVSEKKEVIPENMTDQAEILSNDQSELTTNNTDGSDTKQELLPAKDQENPCFTTKENLVPLDRISKDDHLYDSDETSISSPGGVSNTLGQMDKGRKFVEGGEHNPTDTKFQDSCLDKDEQTDARVGFSGSRRKLGSSRRNKGRRGVTESTPEVLENTSSDGTLQSPTMTIETRREEKKELGEDTEHAITLSLPQDLSSIQSHILSSEDQSSEMRKYFDTDQQLLTDKNELFGDEDYNKSETGVEIIDNSMTVLQQEVDQLDTIHNKDTKDARLDEALRKEEKVDDHQSQMQESLQTECYVGLPAATVSEKQEVIPENTTDQAEILCKSELTTDNTDGSDTKQELLPAKDQENLCFTTKENLVPLDRISKDDHLYDSDETSISCPGGVSNTLGQIDEDGKFVEGGENKPTDTKFHDSSLDKDEQTDARVGSCEQKKLGEDTEHRITLSLPQDLSSIQSNIVLSEDQSSELKKDADTDPPTTEDQQNLSFTTEGNLVALDQTSKVVHLYDSNETSISSPVGVDTTLGQIIEGGILEEGCDHNLPDTKLQETSLSTDKQIVASSSGSRRKLGSSRRNKGRQQGKQFEEEAVESARGFKTNERPTMSIEICTVEEEELREDTKPDIILSISQDRSISLIPTVSSSDDQSSSVPTNYSHKVMQSLTLKSENVREKLDERKADVLAEDEVKFKGLSINKSDVLCNEDPMNSVSENVEKDDSKQIQHSQELCSYETFVGDATEKFEITSKALTTQIKGSVHNMNSIDDATSKQEACLSNEIMSVALDLKNAQQNVRPNTDQILHPDEERLVCVMEENKFASSNFQSENVSLNLQPAESSESVDVQMKVDLHSRGIKKKLATSRKYKGKGKAKDSSTETYNQPTAEVDLNASMKELGEITTGTVPQDQEKSMGIVLEEVEEAESSQTKDVNIGTSGCITLGIQPSTSVDQVDIYTSRCTQIIDGELPKPHSGDHDEYRELGMQEIMFLPEPHECLPTTEMHAEKSNSCEHSEPEREDGDAFKKAVEQQTEPTQKRGMFQTTENERDGAVGNPEAYSINILNQTEKKTMKEDIELLRPEENLQSENLCEPTERTTEKSSNVNHAQDECSVEQRSVSSPQEIFSTDGEENSNIVLSEAAETHLVHVVNEEQKEQIKTEQVQEMHQIPIQFDDSARQKLQTVEDATLNIQPQDNYQSLKDDTHPEVKGSGNRRKLGSSRRKKEIKHGQNQESEALEHSGDNEKTQMLPAQQEELENVILPENLAIFSSTVTEKLLEENKASSYDVLKDCTLATSYLNPNSNQESVLKSNTETKERDTKPIDETDDSVQLTEHDANKNGLMQSAQASVWRGDSDMQSILLNDGIISPRPESACVIDQEEALQRQSRQALSCEKTPLGAEVHLQETNKEIETFRFTTEDCSSEVGSSMDVHDHKQDEVEGKIVYGARQENTSNEFVSASQEPVMDAPDEEEISTTISPLDSQGEKSQATSKQKKRKIGSSRRTPMSRKQEGERHDGDETIRSDCSAKAEMTNLGEMEVVGEVPVNLKVIQGEDVQPQQESSLQQQPLETNTSDGLQSSNTSLVFMPKQSATVDLIIESPKPDDFTSTETQINSEVAERNSNLLHQPVSSNSGTPGGSLELFLELSQSTQVNEHSPEDIDVRQVQDVQEHMPGSVIESCQSQNPGIRNMSLDLTPTNRRRKMGSTRKTQGTRKKQEILEPENESTDTVTSSEDVTMASVSGNKETELQLHTEHTEDNSHQGKEKETVEISQFGESLLRALAEETGENNSTTETERQPSPSELSSSPSNDLSESASGGRRKKLGSSRKSGLQHRKRDQNEDEAEGVHGAAEREESSGMRKISEVDENPEKASYCRNIPEATGFSKPLRDKTSEKLFQDNIRLDQESGGTTSGTDKSNCYNVVLIGESSVGKTSFMKRAQSGKFSLDLPASVGLDSCKWTVVVDGKPVVLQLWDTAGQERFHSITRQVFHKAQAFFLMYDITSSQSFSAVSYWANSIQEAATEDVIVLLLGNKSEHANRQVKTEQGDILGKEYNFEFMECSAATGENVIEALEVVARMLSQRADLLREEATVLHKEPAQRKSSKCC